MSEFDSVSICLAWKKSLIISRVSPSVWPNKKTISVGIYFSLCKRQTELTFLPQAEEFVSLLMPEQCLTFYMLIDTIHWALIINISPNAVCTIWNCERSCNHFGYSCKIVSHIHKMPFEFFNQGCISDMFSNVCSDIAAVGLLQFKDKP